MSIKRIAAITLVLACTAGAWLILGSSLQDRTQRSVSNLGPQVAGLWGPRMTQEHPTLHYESPGIAGGRRVLLPAESRVSVSLHYEPKKKGLLWYRTYAVEFRGEYAAENPTPVAQTLYIHFPFPGGDVSYTDFSFAIDGRPSTGEVRPREGITEAITLPAGGRAAFAVSYRTRGVDGWRYAFGDAARIRNFELRMNADFTEIDFPAGTASPTSRQAAGDGWEFAWTYPDVIGARGIGLEMPDVLNPGPVAARISFFAPVSLLFFFTVLGLAAVVRGTSLHPMNFFFLAAGFFAFHLLFSYLVDLVPLHGAFAVSAAVSLVLVSGYVWLAAGPWLGRLAALAQFAYMVLFSYSFFFDQLTGLTITVGAIITLAVLMVATARIDWAGKFPPAGLVADPVSRQNASR